MLNKVNNQTFFGNGCPDLSGLSVPDLFSQNCLPFLTIVVENQTKDVVGLISCETSAGQFQTPHHPSLWLILSLSFAAFRVAASPGYPIVC